MGLRRGRRRALRPDRHPLLRPLHPAVRARLGVELGALHSLDCALWCFRQGKLAPGIQNGLLEANKHLSRCSSMKTSTGTATSSA
jgi:hypothetical protein